MTRLLTARLSALALLAALCLGIAPSAHAQPNLRAVGGDTYLLDAGDWFFYQNSTKVVEVLPTRLVVRRADRGAVTEADLAALGLGDLAVETEPLPGDYYVAVAPSETRGFEAAEALQSAGPYDFVYFDPVGRVVAAPAGSVTTPGVGSTTGRVPDDEYFPLQKHLSHPAPGNDVGINAPLAWLIETGDPDVLIGHVDSGVDFGHQDLEDNVRLDLSRNFFGVPPSDPPQTFGYSDFYGHGTQAAGIIVAEVDNEDDQEPPVACGEGACAEGVAGIAGGWTQSAGPTRGAGLMIIRVAGDFGETNGTTTARGVKWAADNGAAVMNISTLFDDACTGTYPGMEVLERAVDFAAQQEDVVVVAAAGFGAGQGNPDCVAAPARYASTVAVGFVNLLGDAPDGAAAGPELDLVALGLDVHTTDIRGSGGIINNCPINLGDPDEDRDYTDCFNGTSAAAPQVTGVAALVRSLAPELSQQEVRAVLRQSARDLGDPGFDPETGFGVVDAYQALLVTLETTGGEVGGPGVTLPIDETFTVTDGATLRVLPGTTLRLEPGANLAVRGTLDLDGATVELAPNGRVDVYGTLLADGATFTEAEPGAGWGLVYFRPGSDGTLTNSVIEHADPPSTSGVQGGALTLHNASPTVENNVIRNDRCAACPAVLAYGSATDAVFGFNAVTSSQGHGVYLQAGARLQGFRGNTILIDANGASHSGVVARASFVDADGSSSDPNLFRGGAYGVWARPGSVIDVGIQGTTTVGNFFCFQETANARGDFAPRPNPGGTVYAEGDFWPGATPDVEGNVFTIPVAGSSRCRIATELRPGGDTSTTTAPAAYLGPDGGTLGADGGSGGATPATDLLHQARALADAGDAAGAVALYADLTATYPDAPEALTALDELVRLHGLTAEPTATAHLDGLHTAPGPLQHPARLARARAHELDGEHDAALALLTASLPSGRTGDAQPSAALVFDGRLLAADLHREAGRPDAAGVVLDGTTAAADAEADALGTARWILAMADDHAAPEGDPDASPDGDGSPSARPDGTAPAALALGAAYPNPARGTVTLPVELPAAGALTVAAYDVLGRRVTALHEGPAEPGRFELALDGSGLAPGVYVVRATLRAGGEAHTATRRLTILR